MTDARWSRSDRSTTSASPPALADRVQTGVVDIDPGDPRAGLEELERDLLTDPAPCPGHDGAPSAQTQWVTSVTSRPGLDDGERWLGPADALVLTLGDRLERFPDRPLALANGLWRALAAPERRIDGPDRVTPAFGRDRRQRQIAVGAVVADTRLVPRPVTWLLDHPELVGRQDPRAGPLLLVTAHDPSAGAARVEAEDEAIVVLLELDVAPAVPSDEVSAHRFEADVQIPVKRGLVWIHADVEGHVPLLQVRLHDRPIAVLQARLPEAPNDERKDPGHQVRHPIV